MKTYPPLTRPYWKKIQAADFVSLTAYKDPNSITNGAITVDDATGTVTIDVDSHIAIYDGAGEGATWRTKLATAAYGWRGDGTQAIIVKVSSITNPSVSTKPLVMFGFVDQDGDITDGSVKPIFAGFLFHSTTQMNICLGTSSASSTISGFGTAFDASSTVSYLFLFYPTGNVGDDTNAAGARTASCGLARATTRTSDTVQAGLNISNAQNTAMSDAIYFEVFAGFGAAGAANDVSTKAIFVMEYAIIDILPLGEWT